MEKCCNGEPRSCSLAFCTCACACTTCTLDLRELLLFPRLLLPISTSEPFLTLQGAASCVSSQSSQCRDIQITPKGRFSSSQLLSLRALLSSDRHRVLNQGEPLTFCSALLPLCFMAPVSPS